MKHRENEIYMNFKVRTSRTDGQSPLYVRLTFTGADNAINTGINVNVAKWKRLGSFGYFESVEGVRAKALALKVQVTLRSLKAKGVQDIEFVKEQVAAIAQNEDSEEIENIKKEVERQALNSILGYYTKFYEGIVSGERTHGNNFKEYAQGGISVWKSFGGIIDAFLDGNESVTFGMIDERFSNKFVKFLKDRNYMAKTIGKYTTCFRKLCNSAVKDGIIKRDSAAPYVWGDVTVKDEQKRMEIYLTEEELNAIYNVKLEGKREEVRDLFYIGYQSGQRFSDYSVLTKDNIVSEGDVTLLHLFQKKTGNEVYVPITDARVFELFEKYHYHLPVIREQLMNMYIKDVCELVSKSVPSLKEKYTTLLTAGERSREERFRVLFQRVANGDKLNYNDRSEYNRGKRYSLAHGLMDGSLWERNAKGEVVKYKYELVTSHTARRSKATNMYLQGRLDTDQMMSITGHEKREVFEEYIKVQKLERAKMIAKQLKEGKGKVLRMAK